MTNDKYEKILNSIITTGCDFADIYYENSCQKIYNLVDQQIDKINVSYKHGIGIRSALDSYSRYTASSDISDDNIKQMIKEHKESYKSNKVLETIKLEEKEVKEVVTCKIKHNEYPTEKKIALLHKIDEVARTYSNLVTQVTAKLFEYDKNITIASTRGFIKKTNYVNTRLMVTIFVSENGIKDNARDRYGKSIGYELLEEIDIEAFVKKIVDQAISKLHAITIKGGEYPVILANGFGAVIFHEACGHGLEATSVAPKISCFTDCLGKQIASRKVTLIDDGTIKNAWGSFNIDDEGTEPQKNILIENGVLKSYMVDYLNQRKMAGHGITGSGRREDYTYQPTSRMTNTYIAKGHDKIEDMIKSIKYGIYCESIGGGLVVPASGVFNFQVERARLIENGHLTSYLKEICLRGTGKDILPKIEMVSDDLELADGICGSDSGHVFVNVGQPTIKVSKMQVGGKDE